MSLRAVLCVLGAAACCASGEAQSQTRRGAAAAAPSSSILVDGQPVGDIDVRGEAGALLIPKDALVDILTPAFGSDRAAMAQLSKLKDRNGQIAIGALRDAGFVADVDGNRLIIRRTSSALVATRAAAAPDVAKVDRASVAGGDLRGKSMSFPVVVNSLRLGDVWIRYDRGNSPLIAKAALIDS